LFSSLPAFDIPQPRNASDYGRYCSVLDRRHCCDDGGLLCDENMQTGAQGKIAIEATSPDVLQKRAWTSGRQRVLAHISDAAPGF
jgi:hypothetical protein